MKEVANSNYAFIDGQNLYLGSKDAGIDLSYKKFRVYLKEKYNISCCYLFIGYIAENRAIYDFLQDSGYLLKFKPVLLAKDGQRQKGDIDADLAFNVMRYYKEYGGALLVTSDGDFDTLVNYLRKKNKLVAVISPNKEKCSVLLEKAAQDKMFYLQDIGSKILKNARDEGEDDEIK